MAQTALEMAQSLGATYADVRLIRTRSQAIDVKSGRLEGVTNRYGGGIGVRAFVDGAWGFAGNPDLKLKKIKIAVERAVEIAKASAKVKAGEVKLAPVEPTHDNWSSPCKENPFDVPLEEKLDLLFACTEEMMKVEGLALCRATMNFREENKLFVSTEGLNHQTTDDTNRWRSMCNERWSFRCSDALLPTGGSVDNSKTGDLSSSARCLFWKTASA